MTANKQEKISLREMIERATLHKPFIVMTNNRCVTATTSQMRGYNTKTKVFLGHTIGDRKAYECTMVTVTKKPQNRG